MKISDVQMRDAFINTLYSRAKSDSNILFLSNEQGAESLDIFREQLPKQFINAGVSEQNIISVAAGLALGGKKVYVYSIASFITLRCYEQIKIDLCVMNLPVTILGVGASYSYGVDGPTHHTTEDISIMRALSNMSIYSPADSNSTVALVDISLNSSAPMYIRLDREKLPVLYDPADDFHSGFSVLHEGDDGVCIISTGVMVHTAIGIANELEKKSIQVKVIDIYRLKPLDIEAVVESIKKSKKLITLEEHTINGGLGSIIAELLVDADLQIPLKRLAIKDELLYAYGIRQKLHQDRKLDKKSIVKMIMQWFEK